VHFKMNRAFRVIQGHSLLVLEDIHNVIMYKNVDIISET